MLRVLLAVAAAASVLLPLSADAAPDLPVRSPVKVVDDSRPCPSGYSQIGWVGLEGSRQKVCTGSPINQ